MRIGKTRRVAGEDERGVFRRKSSCMDMLLVSDTRTPDLLFQDCIKCHSLAPENEDSN